ncbi:uncharacterized [Tachysurus ichikawai]
MVGPGGRGSIVRQVSRIHLPPAFLGDNKLTSLAQIFLLHHSIPAPAELFGSSDAPKSACLSKGPGGKYPIQLYQKHTFRGILARSYGYGIVELLALLHIITISTSKTYSYSMSLPKGGSVRF